MGWVSYMANHYKNGKVDRKSEMDEIYTWSSGEHKCEVLKSRMVGAIYYAAVKVTDKGDTDIVGVVSITSTKWDDGMNFGYKGMDETMHPFYYDCPATILNLLTPTDNENANKWREICRKKLEQKKNKTSKANLPVGSVIRYKLGNGEEVTLLKHSAAYQFKRPFWYNSETNTYVPSRRIPDNYEVIEIGG